MKSRKNSKLFKVKEKIIFLEVVVQAKLISAIPDFLFQPTLLQMVYCKKRNRWGKNKLRPFEVTDSK